jgi:PAS domain S-box-containing protein
VVKTDFSEKVINQRIIDMLGYSKEEFSVKKISEYTHPEDRDNHSPYFQEMLQGKRTYIEFMKRYLTSDGKYIPTKTFVSSIFNAKGERTHNFALYEDISKKIEQEKKIKSLIEELQSLNTGLEQKVKERAQILKTANKELIRSNQDLEQFAYIASHDLQEPLRMIGNFVQLLKRRYNDKIDEEGQQYIDFAVEGVQRMSDLIRALLEYSRIGRKEGKIRPINVEKIIESKLHDLRHLIVKRKAVVNIQRLPDKINCEAQQIGNVFSHLIENGLKFNQNDIPVINISGKALDSHFHFVVQDNGIGIEPKYHEQAFEIFKRLHTREAYEGNGIGLALCRKIIHRHNGKIWMENNENEGISIHFTIDKYLTS